MPLPAPKKDEKEKAYISRCVKSVMGEGAAKDNKQAVAMCHTRWGKKKSTKRDLTLSEKETLVRQTWEKAFGGEGSELQYTWPRYVFEDYLVVTVQGKYVKVPYAWGDDGVEFADVKEWKVVEHSFQADMAGIERRIVPVPIRAIESEDGVERYKCHGVLFGDGDHLDSYGTYFDAKTNYYLGWFDKRPWLYHHGMHPMMGLSQIGEWVETGMDEEGVFLIGELLASFKHQDAVKELLSAEVLYPSQGTLGYTMKKDWKTGHIIDWPLIEVSSTVAPANLYQKAITPEVARAIRALQGGIMEDQEAKNPVARARGILDTLFSRRDVKPEAEATEPGPGSDPNTETPVEAQAPSWEEAAKALQIPTIVEAIVAADKHIQSLSARVVQLEGVVEGMAKEQVEQVQEALKGGSWFSKLFSASQSGDQAGEKLAGKAAASLGANAKESPAAFLLAQQQRE